MSSIGVRIPDELLDKLEEFSEAEGLDRSTVIRQLLERGYNAAMLEQAADRYRRGEVTMTRAAEIAGCTIWELERQLVQEGYISSYSIAELERERESLRAARENDTT